jgi:hypothetical protein
MTQVKEIALPLIKDSKDKKVTAGKPDILDSDVANAIDGAVSASLKNKFAAASQNLEKMPATHMNQMKYKFSKFFGNIYMRLLLIPESRLVVLVMTSRLCKFLNFLHHLNPR